MSSLDTSADTTNWYSHTKVLSALITQSIKLFISLIFGIGIKNLLLISSIVLERVVAVKRVKASLQVAQLHHSWIAINSDQMTTLQLGPTDTSQ